MKKIIILLFIGLQTIGFAQEGQNDQNTLVVTPSQEWVTAIVLENLTTSDVKQCVDEAFENSEDLDLSAYKKNCPLKVLKDLLGTIDFHKKLLGLEKSDEYYYNGSPEEDDIKNLVSSAFDITKNPVDYNGFKIFPVKNQVYKDILKLDSPVNSSYKEKFSAAKTRSELMSDMMDYILSIQVQIPDFSDEQLKTIYQKKLKQEEQQKKETALEQAKNKKKMTKLLAKLNKTGRLKYCFGMSLDEIKAEIAKESSSSSSSSAIMLYTSLLARVGSGECLQEWKEFSTLMYSTYKTLPFWG